MNELFSIISLVITNILSIFGIVSSFLLNNPIFQLIIGIIILGIIIGLLFTLVKFIKKMQNDKLEREWEFDTKVNDIRNNYIVKNGKILDEEEIIANYDSLSKEYL